MIKGNLVNWETTEFDIENMEVLDVTMDSICIPTRPGHVLFPDKRNFTAMVSLCQKFQGIPSIIKDEATLNELSTIFDNQPACHSTDGGIWITLETIYFIISLFLGSEKNVYEPYLFLLLSSSFSHFY